MQLYTGLVVKFWAFRMLHKFLRDTIDRRTKVDRLAAAWQLSFAECYFYSWQDLTRVARAQRKNASVKELTCEMKEGTEEFVQICVTHDERTKEYKIQQEKHSELLGVAKETSLALE